MGQLTQTFEEVQNRMDLIVPKDAGTGYKVDEASPDYGWRDITADIVVRNIVATSPTFAAWKGGIRQYQFSSNDEVFHVFHMPHDWVPGTDIYIHAHWSNSASTTGNAVWGFEVTWAKGFDQVAFGTNITTTATQAASATAYQHMVDEVQLTASTPTASQIDTDDLEVDGLFIVRTYLDATHTLSNNPFLHTVDLHYQTTDFGTKDKAPPFYGA